MPYLFILGAKDPEMDRIEEILQNANQVFTQAKVNGVRVHAGNTYTVDEIPNLNQYTPVWIECSKFEPGHGIYIDHHRPGDVGYSKPPAHFWKASSLGQLHELLDLKPSHNDIVLAAMDHCFAPALQGECPGVTPEEVRFIKYLEIEKTTGANLQEINSLVDLYTQTLSTTPTVRIGSEDVYDLRSLYLGEGYSLNLLCAQVAVAGTKRGALLYHRDKINAPQKWSLAGMNSPDTVRAFKETWGPARGLVKIYGVPDRGYAGGYLPN